MKFFRTHLFGCISTAFGVVILGCIFQFDFNVFDSGLHELLRFEINELDELLTGFLLIIIGLSIDFVRAAQLARKSSEIDEQRLLVLRATMRTVQDLVGNFLSNMQLFRMEGEDGPLSPESLKLFDQLIQDASEKLKALGDSNSVVEYKMASGTGILPRQPPSVPTTASAS